MNIPQEHKQTVQSLVEPQMMKQIKAMLAVLLSASVCIASGWNDYTLDINDGYNVSRANSMDVSSSKANGRLILSPRNHDSVGPAVVRYITTSEHIFTKNYGRAPRNLSEGDSFQNVDSFKKYYFVIVKTNEEVNGPFSAEKFLKRTEVASLNDLDWQIPMNPNR